MAEITIFHNPRCTKSRQAMASAEDGQIDVDVVPYLEAPPDAATLTEIVAKLEDPVIDLVRAGDARKAGHDLSELTTSADVVAFLVKHPQLMERPLLVRPDKAIIGRPTERVGPFLSGE